MKEGESRGGGGLRLTDLVLDRAREFRLEVRALPAALALSKLATASVTS